VRDLPPAGEVLEVGGPLGRDHRLQSHRVDIERGVELVGPNPEPVPPELDAAVPEPGPPPGVDTLRG